MHKDKTSSGYFINEGINYDLNLLFRSTKARESQKGAIASLLGHFTVQSEPAIVSMPTGTGKTAVIMLLPYLLKSRRTLIITSSRLVRSQIVEDFQKLTTLKKLGLVDKQLQPPLVKEISSLVKSEDDWTALEETDVVVSLPNSISPEVKNVCLSKTDFFDLILFDEAHHIVAKTWDAILGHYSQSQKALFTATPFRRDLLNLPGKIIYAYPVTKAFTESTIKPIHYIPVEPAKENGTPLDIDILVAKAAERQFIKDKKAGFDHRVIVRTDEETRAKDLHDLYKNNTRLKLELIHSHIPYLEVKEAIKKLRLGSIDGLVCVDMLGEGFDLPQLKIAAIHTPHKSLAVTLQFIGRFSRTAHDKVGEASFIAAPSSVKIEGHKLYVENTIWQNLIPELADLALTNEVYAQEIFASFSNSESASNKVDPALIRTIKAFCHFKIYNPLQSPNFREPLTGFLKEKVILKQSNGNETALVIVTEQEQLPRWSKATELVSYQRHLYFLYFNKRRNALFIHSSDTSETTYSELIKIFCKHGARVIAPKTAHQALYGLTNFNFFNIGVRGRMKGPQIESYKIASGKKVHLSLSPVDPARFVQGHIQCTALEGSSPVTIAYSASGKIWEMQYKSIPKLIQWCDKIAERIGISRDVETNTAIDHLPLASLLERFDKTIVGAAWNAGTYKAPPELIRTTITSGEVEKYQIHQSVFSDFSLSKNGMEISLSLFIDEKYTRLKLSLDSNGAIEYSIPDNEYKFEANIGRNPVSLAEYLTNNPLTLYAYDFSIYSGNLYYEAPITLSTELSEENFEIVDWQQEGIDIESEKEKTKKGDSIFTFIEREKSACHDILYADDSAKEAADFIGLSARDNDLTITFYHCKKSSKPKAGSRVDDLYEVAGQAIKSFDFLTNTSLIFSHIQDRYQRQKGKAKFVNGSLDDLLKLKAQLDTLKTLVKVVIVQPSISFEKQSRGDAGKVLLAASQFLHDCGGELLIIGSK